jgi:hypothetical protein
MTFSQEQIEWIVAEVLRRLGAARGESDSVSQSELRIAERVVTMRSIENRLAGVTRVVVEPRAVVTPAVKDELKARKVELCFQG